MSDAAGFDAALVTLGGDGLWYVAALDFALGYALEPAATGGRSMQLEGRPLARFWRFRRRVVLDAVEAEAWLNEQGRSQASNWPFATFWPSVGSPPAGGSMRPGWLACTPPLAAGSAITRPFNSTVAASGASDAIWVRTPSWCCTAFGTNTPPSGRRCGALPAGSAAAVAGVWSGP